MDAKITETLEYYFKKRNEIKDFVNNSNDLKTDQIIENGEELAILEYKITALQVALEN
ncbi:hypothetical protein GCM10023311_13750 [Flaviramulus aquimarinus]|uniref:Phage protein n=1 Tax=Flaviramulus aquimarinus TaxID=1170456 RepID=A0ABP9F0P6_9FLAO